MRELNGRIVGGVTYCTALFDQSTVQRYLGYLQRLLQGMVADQHQPIDLIDILPAAEREQIVVQWNRTEAAYPADQCIHELFEAQVSRTPEAIALIYEQQQLSYAQLNAQANRLARHLIDQGVGAGYARGAVRGARGAHGGGTAGGAEGRRGVRAAGSDLPRPAPGVHAGGQRPAGAAAGCGGARGPGRP